MTLAPNNQMEEKPMTETESKSNQILIKEKIGTYTHTQSAPIREN
jgi:hypothetical protein